MSPDQNPVPGQSAIVDSHSGNKTDNTQKSTRRLIDGTTGTNLFLWLAGSTLFALSPLAANYMTGLVRGRPPGWLELISGGELCIISAAVSADAIAKALRGGQRYRNPRIVCGVGCLLLLIASSLLFGAITSAMTEHHSLLMKAIAERNLDAASQLALQPPVNVVALATSFWLFLFTVTTALSVVYVNEDDT
jgi:hypothetical protein